MKAGTFDYRPGIEFRLTDFSASMRPRGTRMPTCLARTTHVDRGFVVVDAESLTRLFQQKLQHSTGKLQLRDVKIEFKDNEALITGAAEKGVPVHFSIQGPVDAMGGKELRLYARKVSAMGIPVKGLLEMIGLQLGSVLHLQRSKGVIPQENSLFFDPEDLAHIVGHIEKAEIRNDRLEGTFSKKSERNTRASR